jgi:hypothetical protein
MNELKEPFSATNVVHILSNVVSIAARVASMVGDGSSPDEDSCAKDMMGGSFRTLIPHPSGLEIRRDLVCKKEVHAHR